MTPMALRMEGPWHRGNLLLHTNRSNGRLAVSDWSFVRLEIEDARGNKAWTNSLGSMQTAWAGGIPAPGSDLSAGRRVSPNRRRSYPLT